MARSISIYQNLKGDRFIWILTVLLALISLAAVYSASTSLAWRVAGGSTEDILFSHLKNIALGFVVLFICYRLNYTTYSKIAPFLLVVVVPMIAYTTLFTTGHGDAGRWLTIPGLNKSFQPSEIAKVVLIIYIARSISSKQHNIEDFKSAFLPIILPVLIVCGLILPSDLSSAAVLFATCLIMMVIGRVSMKYVAVLLGLGIMTLAAMIGLGAYFPEHIRVGTWVSRWSVFMNGSDGLGQVEMAKMAIANGGWFGQGPGVSQMRFFLAEGYTDFIYSIICEEYGLIGGAVVLAIYIALLYRCVRLLTVSPKAFGALLAIGLGLVIVIQALAHMAVNVNLLPVTGVTLPLVSKGGTSILFTCIAMGMILSVSRYIEKRA